MKKKKEKKKRERHIAIKLFLCIVYSIIITILFVCSYHLYQVKNIILPWEEVKSTKDYTYIDISKMSEKFAFSKATYRFVDMNCSSSSKKYCQ